MTANQAYQQFKQARALVSNAERLLKSVYVTQQCKAALRAELPLLVARQDSLRELATKLTSQS